MHASKEEMQQNIIMIDDLFHVIDLTGKLLNKRDPDEDDHTPFDEFMRYAQSTTITDKDGKDPQQI